MVGLELVAGDVLLGRFRVDAKIGEGGMGSVYLGWHTTLEMAVAIKVIRLQETAAAGHHGPIRLLREARGLARIKSEYVCRPLDFGVLDAGAPFLVLEHLEGASLFERVERGPLAPAQVIDLVIQSAAGLAEAHRLNVVHRDVKPSNIFVTRVQGGEQVAKVLDFGLAKALDVDTEITRGDQILGTPEFMSPEQVQHAPSVDHRTDVWSLGIVLFWALTGRMPFAAPSKARLLVAILDDDPLTVAELRPDLPAALGRIVADCLIKDPEQRVQSMAELATRLAPFAGEAGKRAARVALATGSENDAAETVRNPPEAQVADPVAQEPVPAPRPLVETQPMARPAARAPELPTPRRPPPR